MLLQGRRSTGEGADDFIADNASSPAGIGDGNQSSPTTNTTHHHANTTTSSSTTFDPERNPDVIHLNIGGIHYATTPETLARESDSLFQQLLNGGEEALKQYRRVARRFSNGTYFIDRDGELFAYVLDYMRNGKLLLPDNFKEMARLREEVIFYQLTGLMVQLAPYYSMRYPSSTAKTLAAAINSIGTSAEVVSPPQPQQYNNASLPPTATVTPGTALGAGLGVSSVNNSPMLETGERFGWKIWLCS